MGDPIECEHQDPNNGDTLQLTTQGLAYYRKALNTPIFTDGFRHWGLTADGLAAWVGAVDPSIEALAVTFATVQPRFDVLRGHPGVRVAPSTLRPFTSYPLTLVRPGADLNAPYEVVYGDRESDGAVIRGQPRPRVVRRPGRVSGMLCFPEDLYCQEGPIDDAGHLTGERLRGLLVGGIDVALRSSRTLTTVPSRTSLTTSSSASERRHHASQSVCTFRHVRLTTSLPTAPLNSAPSARRTRRVLVPDR